MRDDATDEYCVILCATQDCPLDLCKCAVRLGFHPHPHPYPHPHPTLTYPSPYPSPYPHPYPYPYRYPYPYPRCDDTPTMEEVKVAAAKEAAEAESRGTESLVPTLPQAETSVPGRRANPSPNPNPNPNPTPYP